MTENQIQAFSSRLDRFLNENLRKILKKLEAGKAIGKEAAAILGGLMSSLEEAGLTQELEAISRLYGKQLKHIREYYESLTGRSNVLSDADIQLAEQVMKFDTSAVENRVRILTDDLAGTLMSQAITGVTPDVDDLVGSFSSGTIANIKSELNTATAGFSRSMTQKKAADLGFELFLYLGPDDQVTRPFCRTKVNKIFDRQQIAAWNNGTDLPADIYCGGYNCRHDLRPISQERAKELIDSGRARRG